MTSHPGTYLTAVPLYVRPSDSQSALVQIAEADIHAVAGLLKLYLRDLPEPLFTDDLYPSFVEANGKLLYFRFAFPVIFVSTIKNKFRYGRLEQGGSASRLKMNLSAKVLCRV